ncbi:MAG: hypothetical protein US81_C0005G0009 [Parcubacteria group bacterium GW2011_GWE2_38_18]|nr:MAG: hypothetical protein US81_C0005G0009 [Parcubacteria group bacterium GW2011_GWE2_38_18]
MKKNIILGFILLLLIVVGYLYNGPIKKWRQDSLKPENFFSKLQTEDIDRIEIENKSKTVLVKKGDSWQVQGKDNFKASPEKITEALEQLNSAKKTQLDLISTNKDKKSTFNTDKSGTEVMLYNNDKLLLDFIVGKLTDDYLGTYVSATSSDETYKIDVDFNSIFTEGEWRDTVITSLDKEKINKIRIQLSSAEYKIEKKNGEWFVGTAKLNKEKVNKIVDLLSNLKATEIHSSGDWRWGGSYYNDWQR